ncbi:hypothetical protein [Subtercola sp. YIM 133946]|uniref:hypothetical protein n=1 Tax=Subtercola sp. YIM 133946 TaxID=3118909 RepID=UPI002F91D00B
MIPTRIVTDEPPYLAVLGELQPDVVVSTRAEGSVVVLDGADGWVTRMHAAAASGARAVVVFEPQGVGEPDHQALGGPGIAVVLDRRWLRPDVAADASAARAGDTVRAVIVECAGLAAENQALVRDGVGWARVLAGGRLRVTSVGSTGAATIVLLEGPDALPVTLSFSTLPSAGAGGLVRVSALGETRTEVTVDGVAGCTEIQTATRGGVATAAQRFESAQRLALRRAMAAIASEGRSSPADLAEYSADAAVTAEILSAVARGRDR